MTCLNIIPAQKLTKHIFLSPSVCTEWSARSRRKKTVSSPTIQLPKQGSMLSSKVGTFTFVSDMLLLRPSKIIYLVKVKNRLGGKRPTHPFLELSTMIFHDTKCKLPAIFGDPPPIFLIDQDINTKLVPFALVSFSCLIQHVWWHNMCLRFYSIWFSFYAI